MVYVVSLQRQGKASFKITIPKKWIEENLEPGAKIVFMVSKDAGVLEIFSERVWHEKYFSKGRDGVDPGTAESSEIPNRSGLADRVGGVYEDKGITPADNIIERA